MNKKEFLEELGGYLAILDEKEQQDILEEYSQHIDMKIENGLSEEDAIRDFGHIGELAGEILEAYHVNPEYKGAGALKVKKGTKAAAKKGKQLLYIVSGFFRKGREAAGRFLALCWGKTKKGIVRAKAALSRPWKGERPAHAGRWSRTGSGIRTLLPMSKRKAGSIFSEGQAAPGGEDGIPDSAGPVYGGVMPGAVNTVSGTRAGRSSCLSGFKKWPGKICRSIGALMGYCLRLVLFTVLWGIRWCWNCCMIFLALISAVFTLAFLFLFGVAAVWLSQGFPFMGTSLMSLGLILCGVSFTYLCVSFLRLHKKGKEASGRKTDDRDTDDQKEETQLKEVRHA